MNKPTMSNAAHRAVMDDQLLADMRVRLQYRAEQAIKQLGKKYLCHPANRVQPKAARAAA